MIATAAPTVAHLLEFRAAERPDHVAYTHLVGEGQAPIRISYAELHRTASGIAADLQQRGLRGRPVLLIYPAGPEFAPAFFGALMAGAIATPVPSPRFASQYRRLEGVCADCDPGAVLSTEATLQWLNERLPAESPLRERAWLATDRPIDGLVSGRHEPRPADIALLQYTSGSTSDPRGVAVSHASLAHNLATITSEFQPSADARLLSWLPHFHDMGLIGGVLSPLTWGGEAILMSPQQFLRRPLRWLEAISEYGVEVSGAPNFAFELCVNRADRANATDTSGLDLSRWRIAFVGAEPIRAVTLDRFAHRFAANGFRRSALLPCYGLAEATLLLTCKPAQTEPAIHKLSRDALARGLAVASDEQDAARLVGCGMPVEQTDLRIVDPETGTPLSARRVGEVWVSGPQVSRGYWNQQEPEAFRAMLTDFPGKAFLRTGDLGFVTEQGEFVFVERLKDLIVLHGQNHACHDLEHSASGSHPLLNGDGLAVCLAETESGPQLVVIAEFPPGQVEQAEEAAQGIRGALFSAHGLSASAVAFVPPGKLSRTTSGKLQRRATLTRLRSGSLRVLAWSGNPISDNG